MLQNISMKQNYDLIFIKHGRSSNQIWQKEGLEFQRRF